MREELPEILSKYIEPLPISRQEPSVAKTIEKFTKLYGEGYVNSQIWTQEEAEKVLNEMGVDKIRVPNTSGIGIKPISQEGTSRIVRAAIKYAIDNDKH